MVNHGHSRRTGLAGAGPHDVQTTGYMATILVNRWPIRLIKDHDEALTFVLTCRPASGNPPSDVPGD